MRFKTSRIYYYRNSEYFNTKSENVASLISLLDDFELDINYTSRQNTNKGVKADILNKLLRELLHSKFSDESLLVESKKNSYPQPYELDFLNKMISGIPDFLQLDKNVFISFQIELLKSLLGEYLHAFTSYLMTEYFIDEKIRNLKKDEYLDNVKNINSFCKIIQDMVEFELHKESRFQEEDILKFNNKLNEFNEIQLVLSKIKLNHKTIVGSKSKTTRGKILSKINDLIDIIRPKLKEKLESDNKKLNKEIINIIGETQVGNWALMKSDIDKVERMLDIFQIDLVVFITATDNLEKKISDGTVNYDKIIKTIESTPYLKLPIIVIGIDIVDEKEQN